MAECMLISADVAACLTSMICSTTCMLHTSVKLWRRRGEYNPEGRRLIHNSTHAAESIFSVQCSYFCTLVNDCSCAAHCSHVRGRRMGSSSPKGSSPSASRCHHDLNLSSNSKCVNGFNWFRARWYNVTALCPWALGALDHPPLPSDKRLPWWRSRAPRDSHILGFPKY